MHVPGLCSIISKKSLAGNRNRAQPWHALWYYVLMHVLIGRLSLPIGPSLKQLQQKTESFGSLKTTESSSAQKKLVKLERKFKKNYVE